MPYLGDDFRFPPFPAAWADPVIRGIEFAIPQRSTNAFPTARIFSVGVQHRNY